VTVPDSRTHIPPGNSGWQRSFTKSHAAKVFSFTPRGRTKPFFAALVVALSLASCRKPAAPATHSQTEIGIASWYGQPFNGRLTASGEIYDMEKMTAAHKILPFGTKVRIQNQMNQQTVEVRINDRGPFVKDRIIDLSHAAAQSIGMSGVANVRLEAFSMPPTRDADMYAVQIGAFSQRSEAEGMLDEMRKQYGIARLVFRDGDQTWRVLVGLEPTTERALSLAQQLEKKSGPAFVVRVDTEK
jgi:rare lipoprotein A